jgi:hypothetical protein
MVGLRLGLANGSRRAHQALPPWQRRRAQGLGSDHGAAGARRSTWAPASSSLGSRGRASGWQHRSPAGAEHACSCVWADGLILRTPVYSESRRGPRGRQNGWPSREVGGVTTQRRGGPARLRTVPGTGQFVAEIVTPDFVWDISNFRGWPEQQVYEDAQGGEPSFESGPPPGTMGTLGWTLCPKRTTKWLPSYASAHGRS